MNWKSFLLGLGTGIVASIAVKELMDNKLFVSPEKALANAKNLFKETGPISGSWIQMKVEPFEKGNLNYKVYKGGISRTVNNQLEQYEFIADALTGSIIETTKI